MPSDDGKRNRKTLSTGLKVGRSSTKANALLREMIRSANCGEEVHGVMERKATVQNQIEDSGPTPTMYFSDYLLFWVDWKHPTLEEITYRSYSTLLRSRICPYFAKKKIRLNEITVLDIQLFYSAMMKEHNVSGNTIIHYHANIRKALSDAVIKLKLIPYNPAADVERPKKDNFVGSFYTAEEIAELLPIFAGTKMEMPVMLAAYFGLRRSEVLGLRWSAVDFKNQTLTVSRTMERINIDGEMTNIVKDRTKNQSSFRCLSLTPEVSDALLRVKAAQERNRRLCGQSYNKEYLDYICVDEVGNLVKPDYVSTTFRETLKKHNMRHIRFHDLRHSCASLLIKNGVDMKQIQQWLGHSSYNTTANIYAHLDNASKMETAKVLSGCIDLSGIGQDGGKKKAPKHKSA